MADDLSLGVDQEQLQRLLARQQAAQPPQIPPGGYPREQGSGLQMRGAATAKQPGTLLTPPADPTAPGKIAPAAAPTIPTAAPTAPGMAIPPPGPAQKKFAAGPPQLSGWRKVLDTIGQIAAPNIEERVPGSVGNYYGQVAERAKEEQAGQTAQLGMGKTIAETPGSPQRAAEAKALQDAEDARAAATQTAESTRSRETSAAEDARTAAERADKTITVAGPDGQNQEMQWNEQTKRYDIPVGAKAVTNPKEQIQTQLAAELAKPKPDAKIVSDLQNRLKQIDPLAEDRLRDAENRAATSGPVAMVPQPDGTMKVVSEKPGTILPKGATSILEAGKEQTALDAKNAAQQYADDYLANKQFTGPGDEALMEKYFELAKPSSGFRMTQAQIEMLQHARDLMGGLEARAKHALTPDAPYFSDTQRQQIVQTMKNIARAGEEVRSGSGSGGPPAAQPGMKVQSRTVNGKTEYRQVPIGTK